MTSQPGVLRSRFNESELVTGRLRESRILLGLCLPALVVVLSIIVVPIGIISVFSLLDSSGAPSLANYRRLIEQPSYLKSFVTTFEVATAVTMVCVVLGYPVAYMLAQLRSRVAGICMFFVLLPFWTPVLVRTYAWLVILQRNGLVNDWLIKLNVIDQPMQIAHSFAGVVIAMSHVLLPFLVFPLYAAMKAIDHNLVRAAMNLGASPTSAFWQVYFPLSGPGLVAGAILVFVLSLGFFVTPAILGGGRVVMWAMRIESAVSLYANWGAASAMGVVLLLATLSCIYLMFRALRLDAPTGATNK